MSRRIQTGTTPSPVPTPTPLTAEEELLPGTANPFSLIAPHPTGQPPAAIVFATPDTKPAPPDGYLDRLLKYIPAEIVALYLGAINVVPQNNPHHEGALWIIAILTTLCTPVYMYLNTREPGKPTLWSQIVISTIAFPIWVFAIGGPFALYGWYTENRWVSALVLSFATFLVAAYQPAPEPPATATPPATD